MVQKILKNFNGTSLLPIILIILFLFLVGGGSYYWYANKNVIDNPLNEDVEGSSQDLLTDEEITKDINEVIEGETENEKIGTYIPPSDLCIRMGGFLEDGLCKKIENDCIDYDAYLGENSKYLPSRTEYKNDTISQEEKLELRDSCRRDGDKYILKEATCSSNIKNVDDFNNSFVEYECENGCNSLRSSCEKQKYTIDGKQIILASFMYQTEIMSENTSITFSGDGLISYAELDGSNTNTIISESEFTELYNLITSLDEYFVYFDNHNQDFDFEDEILKPSKYFDPNKEEGYRIDVNYIDGEIIDEYRPDYYLRKAKGFICNINCPKEITDIENLLKSFKPDSRSLENNLVPYYSYDSFSCSETGNDYACWYNIIATSLPDYTYQESQNNILFSKIDIESDTDNDGINDFNEKYLGTDMYNKDSDGDGYKDIDEIKNGYNPIGDNKIDARMDYYVEEVIGDRKYWTAYESTVKEYQDNIINKCNNIGGQYHSLETKNYNCFGSYEKDDCLSLFGCIWTEYNYCRPMNDYCECSDGDKHFLNLNKSFDGTCN